MPVQENEIKQNKSEPIEDLDETKRKQIANQQEKTRKLTDRNRRKGRHTMMKKMFAAAVITVMTMSAALPVFAAAPAQGYGRGRQQQPAAVAVQECITQDDALAIAMEHAGVTEKDVTWPRVHMDFDDGWQIYEVEFHVGWTEYNYDIDAVTGQILGYESDWGD